MDNGSEYFVDVANGMLIEAIMGSVSFGEVELALNLGADPNAFIPVDVQLNGVQKRAVMAPLVASLMIPNMDPRIVDLLIRNGADAKFYPNATKSGPIHHAAFTGSERILELVANAPGVDLDLEDNEGITPLVFAIEAKKSLNMRVLLNAGANPNYGGREKIFPVIEATKKNSDVLLSVLFEYGADVNVRDFDNSTPLHFAAFLGNDLIIKMLVKHSADLEAKDGTSRTSLLVASAKGHTNAAIALIDAGADINAQDISGMTPLMHAVKMKNVELVNYILLKSPDLMVVDHNGQDVISFAQVGGNQHLVVLLRDSKTKITPESEAQITPRRKVTGV